MRRDKGFTLIELLVVVGIFLIMTSLLAPFVNMVKARARKVTCANNLRRISLALHTYAVDNKDAFPPDLAALYPNYINDENVFDCPANKKIGAKAEPDYKYLAGLTESSDPKEIITQDLDESHKNTGKNILRINGSVEWIGRTR